MAKNKRPLPPITTSVTRKEYINSIGGDQGVTLRFTLRTDNTDELIPFLELLQRAEIEVIKDIKAIQALRKAKAGK